MIQYTALLTALSPIAHGDTQTGTEGKTNHRLFMRSGQYINGIPSRVPDISANALRTTLFRVPLADHLLMSLAIPKQSLPKSVANLLYSGGAVLKNATAPGDQMTLGHALRATYPMLDLLGGSVDQFVLPKSRLRLCCWPVTKEYAHVLRHVAPPEVAAAADQVSVFDLLFEEVRTRGTGEESDGNQMLYSYETLAAGTQLFIEATLDPHTPPQTLGAAGYAIAAWDGFLGGQGRQGRGRMAIEVSTFPTPTAYLEHLETHQAALREGVLSGTFGTAKVLCTG